jgi:hypothetical protein
MLKPLPPPRRTKFLGTPLCRNLFNEFKILPLPSHYVYSVLIFVLYNKVRSINTRKQCNHCQALSSFKKYQNGAYFLGIKVFNNLSSYIRNVSDNSKQFKSTLKNVLPTYSVYSLDAYFQSNHNSNCN